MSERRWNQRGRNQAPPTGLKPHTDVLKEFPYLGTPHAKK